MHSVKSGPNPIYHPIAVAQICAEKFRLGNYYCYYVCLIAWYGKKAHLNMTLDDIKGMFGEKVAQIIDGLTKISKVFDHTSSIQAENFRKMLLALSEGCTSNFN